MKNKHIQAHMRAAHIYAECSTARRLKVGALVVKDDRIISIGYNGMPAGWDNNCEFWEKKIEWDDPSQVYKLLGEGWEWHEDEDGGSYLRRLKTRPEVLHAESNAVSKLARSSESGAGASMFITHSPCIDCAKLIYQSGVVAVYYTVDYRCSSGIEFLKRCGIKVEKIDV
jgi:dCMP deaminase